MKIKLKGSALGNFAFGELGVHSTESDSMAFESSPFP
jgi:hypothetical protein